MVDSVTFLTPHFSHLSSHFSVVASFSYLSQLESFLHEKQVTLNYFNLNHLKINKFYKSNISNSKVSKLKKFHNFIKCHSKWLKRFYRKEINSVSFSRFPVTFQYSHYIVRVKSLFIIVPKLSFITNLSSVIFHGFGLKGHHSYINFEKCRKN